MTLCFNYVYDVENFSERNSLLMRRYIQRFDIKRNEIDIRDRQRGTKRKNEINKR